MQSIRRQIKRGHAVLALNHVTKSLELVQKKRNQQGCME